MTIRQGAAEAGGMVPPASAVNAHHATPPMVRVWDPFVRIFHWSLVTLFAIAFMTGNGIEWLHFTAGYAIAALIGLRVMWGFVGARHARFSDFVRPPGEVISYVRSVLRTRAPRYLGHNPAGGAMVIALLGMLTGISVTGFLMTTDAFWGAQWVEDLHKALVYATLGLVGLHIAGVVSTSIAHRENLVKAMITGRKRAR